MEWLTCRIQVSHTPLELSLEERIAQLRRAERMLLSAILALVAIGLVFIFSTSSVRRLGQGDPTHFLRRQLLWGGLGFSALILFWHTNYRRLRQMYVPLLVAVVIALVLVLIPGIGAKINGARRWLRIGGLGIQPSEVAKLAMIIFVASYVSLRPLRRENWKEDTLPVLAVVGLVSGLILVEPDLGTAVFVATVCGAMLFAAGASFRPLLPYLLAVVPLVLLLAYWKFQHIQARLLVFLYPELDPLGKGHQIRQSLIALGSGGWFGLGLGESRQKLFFLPEDHTDFIFAIVGEELGFLGTALIVALILVVLYSGRRIMNAASDKFGFFLALGILFAFGLQSAMNIAVVTASMPTKGISLPLVSFGGSSMVVTLSALGILLNIGRERRKELVEQWIREKEKS